MLEEARVEGDKRKALPKEESKWSDKRPQHHYG